MSTVRAMICGVAALGAAAWAWGDAASLAEIDGLAPLVERWHDMAEEIGLSGYAIALVRDGELIAAEGFGVRDVGESADASLPVDAATMQIGMSPIVEEAIDIAIVEIDRCVAELVAGATA